MKRILFLLLAIIGGPFMIVSGIKDLQNSKKLVAQGKPAIGQVVDASYRVSRRARIRTYYLTVKFQPENGPEITKKSSVPKALYDQGLSTQTAPLVYLPSNPSIVQIGDKAVTQTSGLIVGSLLFLGGIGFLFYLWSNRQQDSATSINTLDTGNLEPDVKKAA
jgi:hypothetical protein